MLNFKKLLIGIVSIASLSSQAIANTGDTYVLMDSQINNNGQKILFNTSIWYGKEKVRMEHDLKSTNSDIPQGMSKSIMLFDLKSKNMFIMMPNNKTAIKMDNNTLKQMGSNNPMASQMPSNLNTDFLYDKNKIKDEIKKMGGKMTGSEVILGELCDTWEYNSDFTNPQNKEKEILHSKVWISNKINIPLKVEISSMSKGKIMSIKAKELKINQKFDTNLFSVPKDYKITDLQKMMQELLQMKKK